MQTADGRRPRKKPNRKEQEHQMAPKKKAKKVKSLPTKSLSNKQARGVKGGAKLLLREKI